MCTLLSLHRLHHHLYMYPLVITQMTSPSQHVPSFHYTDDITISMCTLLSLHRSHHHLNVHPLVITQITSPSQCAPSCHYTDDITISTCTLLSLHRSVFTNSSGFVQFHDTEGPLGLPNVYVGWVVVTRDIVDCLTLVLQWRLVLWVYNLRAQCVGRLMIL